VNGFHVHAVGWVLTVNARALNRQEVRELTALWTAFMRARNQDFHGTLCLNRLLFPRSTRLSVRTMNAFGVVLERMVALHPERFGEDALLHRRDHWLLQALASFLLGLLAASFLPVSWPMVREAVQTLFLMGLAFLVPTIILWRAARAAKYFAARALEMESFL